MSTINKLVIIKGIYNYLSIFILFDICHSSLIEYADIYSMNIIHLMISAFVRYLQVHGNASPRKALALKTISRKTKFVNTVFVLLRFGHIELHSRRET